MTNEELTNKVAILEERLNAYELSDRFMFFKMLQMADGRNIQLGKAHGTKIGTEALQKLGFFGAAPVAQQSHIPAPSGGTTVDSEARAAISSLITASHNLGFTA